MLSKRRYLFGTTILASVLAMAAPALAQEAPLNQAANPQDEDATTVEEIVVTGSRIRRDPTNAPTPLIQVEREQLLTTGQSSVINYLSTIPALSNSQLPSDTTAFLGIGGLSLPNLRALGSGRTLTLVDGRRHVGSSGGSLAVDIDVIPRLLIENIEIITGGAASIYGADAVSGVLNFILRDDFEGIEIDTQYSMINQDGQANKRFSALIGHNFFDDRLNVYAHGEYEELDEIQSLDIDWLEESSGLFGIDADPISMPFDGLIDTQLFSGVSTLQRPRWGQTTLANSQQASPLNNPNVPFTSCNPVSGTGFTSGNCYSVDPTRTYVFVDGGARLADFGQRVGNTGANRPNSIGGDGDNPSEFGTITRVPQSESRRFQAGATLAVTDNIDAYVEAKYVDEDTNFSAQPVFFDFLLADRSAANEMPTAFATNLFQLRYSDNAFIPDNLKAAIAGNRIQNFAPPTATAPGVPTTSVAAPFARHTLFGNNRNQSNNRELQRYVVGLRGQNDNLGFVRNFGWDIGYTYGEVDVVNFEQAVDAQRFGLAADSVFDVAGVVNGRPGQIVCRAQLLQAQGTPRRLLDEDGNVVQEGIRDDFRDGDIRDSVEGQRAIDECTPLNIFGKGNQSAEALDYVNAGINVRERNEQEQAVVSVSGQLWDFFGAGALGVALGAEYRREFTEGIGRDADTGDRFLFLNTGPDFPGAEYDSTEYFAELSLPLFQDSFLGEYAELSGSYRIADYSTVGEIEVYGVNLVYRPVQDITFKTSFNTSARVPNLEENFSPFSQTFFNNPNDPCATASINAATLDPEIRTNRIANCTALAAAKGLTYDFAGATDTNLDDYVPVYTGGIAGVLGGNPLLEPEESESFTFSAVYKPRFIPNFSLVLDYYEIEIDDVIAAVSAQTAANNCVNGAELNEAACATIFRNVSPAANPTSPQEASEAFKIGAPAGDPIGGFIQGSINYAALQTRGMDFTARYSLDTFETFGREFGRFDYSISGLWLITQQQAFNAADPDDIFEEASLLSTGGSNARVRFSSSLTYTPTEALSINWTVDWQTAQDIIIRRNFVNNADSRLPKFTNTGNFARHDFTVRYDVRDDLSVRAGVVNAFDEEQAPWLGTTLYSNFDPYGRRFFIGLNYRPF